MKAKANYLPTEGICNQTQITESIAYDDIGYIAYPKLVRSNGDELFYQVGVFSVGMIAISSDGFTPTDANQQTILSQYTKKSISTHTNGVLMKKIIHHSKELSATNSLLEFAMP